MRCILFMLEMIKEFRLFCRIIYHRVWINLGDSLFYVVIMWVLYDLTRDPLYPSMGGFMFSLSDVLNFFCGPVMDRSDQGRLLVVSSGIQFLIAAALYLLSAKGCLSVWMLVSHCYECPRDCKKGLLFKIKPYGFTVFIKRYGMEELMDCLERNEKNGIVYHREGIWGDYDDFDDVEALIQFIKTGERS